MIEFALNQNINSIDRESSDGWGDNVYYVIYQSVRCKFSYSVSRALLAGSEQDIVEAECYIESWYEIEKDDRILFDNQYYIVHRVEKLYDIMGNTLGYRLLLKTR